MKSTKTDARSRYTQMIIKKSLLKLAAAKPIKKITVAELCADAGTNRITFYNNFYDIYDVYETIENDFCDEIIPRFTQITGYYAEYPLIHEVLLHLYRNADMCTLFIKTNSNVITRIMNAIKEKYIAEISAHYKQIPLSTLNLLYIFQTHGCVGLIIDWINSGFKQSPEEFGALMTDFNKSALNGVIGSY